MTMTMTHCINISKGQMPLCALLRPYTQEAFTFSMMKQKKKKRRENSIKTKTKISLRHCDSLE